MRNFTLKNYLPLFKVRICTLIAFSAVTGLVSARLSAEAFSLKTAALLVLSTLLASAGVSAFNHYFDADVDSRMSRTKARPFAAGRGPKAATVLILAAFFVVASLVVSTVALNYMVALHLFLGAFVYAVVYTVWLKRRSAFNIVVGGLAGSFAVMAGGASATPEFCLPPLLFAVVMFFWTPTHFWCFAVLHKDDYQRAGIPMLPNVVGDKKTAIFMFVNTVLLVASSFLPHYFSVTGVVYAVSAGILGVYILVMNAGFIRDFSRENARRNFRASMLYLGGLFLAVIVDTAL